MTRPVADARVPTHMRQMAVLDALNMASTQHRTPAGYRATAAQVADMLTGDERYHDAYAFTLTARQVGTALGQLGAPHYGAPMVERVDSRAWRLTDEGTRWLLLVGAREDERERREGYEQLYAITEEVLGNESPPIHLDDRQAEAWRQGRDAAIEHLRDDLASWRDRWELVERPARPAP